MKTAEEKAESHRESCRKWYRINSEKLRYANKSPEEKKRQVSASAKWSKNNPDKVKEIRSTYITRHAHKFSEYNKQYRAENKQKIQAAKRDYYKENSALIRERVKAWKNANPHLVAAFNAGRKKAVRQATPKWADKTKINAWYLMARTETERLGVQCHVDHIIPIVHEMVCGLHNEFNLQVLTLSENCSKQNTWYPD